MRDGKKTLGIVLTALLVVLLGCCMSKADSSEVEPAPPTDFVYVSNGSEIQINEYRGKGGVVRIPDEIDGMPVTRIGDKVFNENETITGVILPRYLTYIGDRAFHWCRNLTGVVFIPPYVKTVKDAAFCGSMITGLIVSADCQFESQTFMYCDELEFIYITEGSSPQFGWLALWSQDKIKTAIVPSSVNNLHEQNFGKSNLVTIYTPEGSTAQKFAQEHFINCNTDQYETIQREYYQKYEGIINREGNISSESLTSENQERNEFEGNIIDNNDVSRGSDLYTYSIKGNGSVSIIDYDWSKSSGDIYIPTMLDGYSVTAISDGAFSDGKKVRKDNCLVVIPDSITIIGEKAFFNSPVSAVSIPTSIKSIGKAAFAYCDITQFIVDQDQPNYATIDGVLYDKRNRSLLAYPQKKNISVSIPEGIVSIGEYAFSGLTIGGGDKSSLCFTDILPSTLTRIEPHAFENCTIYYSTNNAQSGITYYNSNGDDLILLPSMVTSVGGSAFSGCTFKCSSSKSPQRIVIGENLEEIEDNAFSGCRFYDGFEYELLISQRSMDRIGDNAFASSILFSSGNDKMKVRILLPEEVDEIGENAFFETHPVCIPAGMEIKSIDEAAFRNTIAYTTMKKEKYQNATPDSLTIPGKMKTVSSQAFAYRTDDALNTVETIDVQEGIKKIEDSAFAGRKALQTVLLPMTLTEIGDNAFAGCLKMEKINIPESVTKIGDNAFERQYVTLIVKEDSYAEIWASENGYNYRFEQEETGLDWLNSDLH